MTRDEIEKLLNLYYEGETTVDQESALEEYFTSAGCADADFEADARYFRAVASLRTAVPDDLERRILNATVEAPRRRIRLNLRVAMSVAASLMLLIAVGTGLLRRSHSDDVPVTQAPVLILAMEKAAETEEVTPEFKVESPTLQDAQTAVSTGRQESEIDPYRLVSDPLEAVEIASETFEKLQRAFSKAGRGVDRVYVASAVVASPFEANKILKQ